MDAQHGAVELPLSSEGCPHAGVALTLNGLVALGRRIEVCPHTKKPPPFAGYWSVFCGAIEDGETAEEAGVREVKEETGLDINIDGLVFLGKIRSLALFTYELNEYTPIELDYEHTEYGYFKISQIHNSPSPVDDEIADALQIYYL